MKAASPNATLFITTLQREFFRESVGERTYRFRDKVGVPTTEPPTAAPRRPTSATLGRFLVGGPIYHRPTSAAPSPTWASSGSPGWRYRTTLTSFPDASRLSRRGMASTRFFSRP